MKILITGVAGFIGSNIAEAINRKFPNYKIIGVDNLHSSKYKNLININLCDYYDKTEIDECLNKNKFEVIFHQGACSDTMEINEKYIIKNNFDFSKKLFLYARENKSRFIYASSAATYGLEKTFIEEKQYENPLNPYGYSKLLFDNFIRLNKLKTDSFVGLRYFNVYGQKENHKGRMASVVYHFYNQFIKNNKIKIFGSYGGYSNGMHERDFVYIKDVVDVNIEFMINNEINGIYNLGTGKTLSYNEIGRLVICSIIEKDISLNECLSKNFIEYVDFPEDLKDKYQCYTKADLSNLLSCGINYTPSNQSNSILEYVNYLKSC